MRRFFVILVLVLVMVGAFQALRPKSQAPVIPGSEQVTEKQEPAVKKKLIPSEVERFLKRDVKDLEESLNVIFKTIIKEATK